jgi:DNA-binding transcriptional regulator YdaS (Cro superfamily)
MDEQAISDALVALQRAVAMAGGQKPLADKITAHGQYSVKQGHIWWWLNRSRKCPANRAIAVEKAVDGRVTRYELRADVFREHPEQSAAS